MSEPVSFVGPLAVANATAYRSSRGVTYVWHPLPHLFATRVEGYFGLDGLAAIETASRRAIASGKSICAFHDWWELSDYVTEARSRLTTLGKEQSSRTEASHILVQSKLLALAVQTASVLLPYIRAYSSRDPFERRLRDTLRGRSGAP